MALTPADPAKAQIWVRGEAPNQVLDIYVPRGARGEVGPMGPEGPAVPTTMTVLETTTGPETPGATGPQGLTGAKGDPGGLVDAAIIASTTNLNDIITPGTYRTGAAADATLALNYPVAGRHLILMVLAGTTTVYRVQEAHTASSTDNGSVFYRRVQLNGVWQPWKVYSSARVDQTAGRVIYQWDDVNNREQLIYGDTGWRDITSLLLGDFVAPATAPRFAIRRIGNSVSFSARINPAASIATTNRSVGRKLLASYPTGFSPSPYESYNILGSGSVDTPSKAIVQIANLSTLDELWVYGDQGTWNTADIIQVRGTWLTELAWPTALPGSALGSIPNI